MGITAEVRTFVPIENYGSRGDGMISKTGTSTSERFHIVSTGRSDQKVKKNEEMELDLGFQGDDKAWNSFENVMKKSQKNIFGSFAETASITSCSESSVSHSQSRQSSYVSTNEQRLDICVRQYSCDDRIRTSSSLDSHFDQLALKDIVSTRRIGSNQKESKRNTLPPIPRSPSPFHSRLAETYTKSNSLRRQQSQQENKARENDMHKPPFYTTIAKANSFSDSTVSSISMQSFVRRQSFNGKVSPSSYRRLAESETRSSSMRRQKRREVKPNTSDKRRPFYTTVTTTQSPAQTTFHRTSSIVKGNSRNNERINQRRLPSTSRRIDKISGLTQRVHQSKAMREEQLFTRLAKQETVSSSRIKSFSLQSKMTPYEKKAKMTKAAARAKRDGNRNNISVYDRLAYTGTASSLQKNRNSSAYKEKETTFHESCKTALMREFKGSTFVHVTKQRVSTSVIGTVVHC